MYKTYKRTGSYLCAQLKLQAKSSDCYILASLALDGSTTITDTVLLIFITLTVFHMQEELANLCSLRHYDWGVFVLKVNTCPSGNGQGKLANVAIDDGRNKYGSNTRVLG